MASYGVVVMDYHLTSTNFGQNLENKLNHPSQGFGPQCLTWTPNFTNVHIRIRFIVHVCTHAYKEFVFSWKLHRVSKKEKGTIQQFM